MNDYNNYYRPTTFPWITVNIIFTFCTFVVSLVMAIKYDHAGLLTMAGMNCIIMSFPVLEMVYWIGLNKDHIYCKCDLKKIIDIKENDEKSDTDDIIKEVTTIPHPNNTIKRKSESYPYTNVDSSSVNNIKKADERVTYIATQIATLLSVKEPLVEDCDDDNDNGDDEDNGVRIKVTTKNQEIVIGYFTFRIHFGNGKLNVGEYSEYKNKIFCVAEILAAVINNN